MEKDIQKESEKITRPPVVVVMGHIDHGKTTLLDKIRETNVAGRESGGITQHIGAYEAVVKTKDGREEKITFIDTPGHEAFSKMRSRGARAADIAILVVAADDGVKPQTEEAMTAIKRASLPFVVAINKIDKGGADPERVKKELAEREVYLEGWGGQTPVVNISAKTGEGIAELLETVLLVAELEPEKFATDYSKPASGVVIESHLDSKRGKSATLLILDGTLKQGDFVVAGSSFSPVRIFENFEGKSVGEAYPAEPVRIVGFDNIPEVGLEFQAVRDKASAEKLALNYTNKEAERPPETEAAGDLIITIIPLVLKADTAGSLEAIAGEIKKFNRNHLQLKMLKSDTGPIGEDDVAVASSGQKSILLGFKVKVERAALQAAERFGVKIKTFDIIYELLDWVREYVESELPSEKHEEAVGRARVLKIFSKNGSKQVVGGVVLSGRIKDKGRVRIYRRENMLALGKIIELQQAKMKAAAVEEGNEFGVMIDAPIEIAARDEIEVIEEKIIKRTL